MRFETRTRPAPGSVARAARWLAGAAALALAASCGGGGSAGGNGSLRLALTDAPSCGYKAVHITVEKVRVHKSSSAGESDGGWSEVVLATPKRVDLLSLTNGVLEELGQTSLPAGKYTQLRLVLAPNDATNPPANSVTPTDGTETALTTPSGQQSGLKANIDIDIEPDKLADFAIDIDVCKSIVRRGNSGQFNLKPVIGMIPLAVSGVVGFLDGTIVPATAVVSVQQDGVPKRATPPLPDGRFVLAPVPPGTYDLVVSAAGRVTAVVTGVTVVESAVTTLNTETTRINPPAAGALRTVSGTVKTGASPVEAVVSVHRLLAGGKNIEVSGQPADGTTGEFSFSLPVDKPVVAKVEGGVLQAFGVDTADTLGKYTLKATSGASSTPVPVDFNVSGGTADVSLGEITVP